MRSRDFLAGWRLGVLPALGGAVFACGLLALAQGLAVLVSRNALLQNDGLAAGIVLVAWSVVALLSLVGLHLAHWTTMRAVRLVLTWTLCYGVLWILAGIFGRVSLLLFVPFWALVGAISLLVMREPKSPYGRLPRATMALLSEHVRLAEAAIVTPFSGPPPALIRATTIEAVLERTLRDWWQNGNTTGLQPPDVADLQSFVALAIALCHDLWEGDGPALYRALLGGLLDDWLYNWNAEGTNGPPQRD